MNVEIEKYKNLKEWNHWNLIDPEAKLIQKKKVDIEIGFKVDEFNPLNDLILNQNLTYKEYFDHLASNTKATLFVNLINLNYHLDKEFNIGLILEQLESIKKEYIQIKNDTNNFKTDY